MLRWLLPPADPQRREWWWLAWVGLLAAGLLAAGLWLERERTQARECALLTQQAQVLHDNLGEQLEAVNNTLTILRADLRSGPDAPAGQRRLMERMRNFADAVPAVRSFSLLDAQGRVLASSAADVAGRDLSQREYFQTALRAGHSEALIVGQPVFGMLGGWVLVLGRTVADADGAFAGLLVAALDVEHFQTLLQSVRYAPDMRVSLSHGDGLRVMILGDDNEPDGVSLAQPGTLFTRHPAARRPACSKACPCPGTRPI